MYFSDVSNKGLTKFHNSQNISNFNISLTDLLSSELFNVETIISDSLYRVYPLFYCKEITSTNSADIILDNRCLILTKKATETYLTFIGDVNEPVNDYKDHSGYYNIEDKLSDSEFNAIVQLLRHDNSFQEAIGVSQGTVKGVYGDYIFDINSTTLIDTGILITKETISNFGTVKLTNAVFPYSTYTLKLKVYHTDNVNVTPEDSSDNIEVETISVVLINDVEVNIPFDDYDFDDNYVIGFDASVEIVHDKPFIHYIKRIILESDKSIIQTGENCEIYATALDYNNAPLSGDIVYFYEKLEPLVTRLYADPSIIQTGGTSDFYATVKDADGSIAKDVDAYFYQAETNGYLINDSAEYSCTSSEGLKSLFEICNLSKKWELSCDFKTNGESRFMIGRKDTFTGNPNYSIFVGSPNGTTLVYYGYRDTSTRPRDINADPTSYSTMKIEFDDGDLSFIVGGWASYQSGVGVLNNINDLVIGLVCWGTNKTCYVKNIKLKVYEED